MKAIQILALGSILIGFYSQAQTACCIDPRYGTSTNNCSGITSATTCQSTVPCTGNCNLSVGTQCTWITSGQSFSPAMAAPLTITCPTPAPTPASFGDCDVPPTQQHQISGWTYPNAPNNTCSPITFADFESKCQNDWMCAHTCASGTQVTGAKNISCNAHVTNSPNSAVFSATVCCANPSGTPSATTNGSYVITPAHPLPPIRVLITPQITSLPQVLTVGVPTAQNTAATQQGSCYSPEEGTSGNCSFISAHHMCDAGDGGSVPPSAVSSGLTGNYANGAARFNDVVNKKLACCMNSFTNGSTDSPKFDCIDNSASLSAGFNTLWSTGDDASEGGQLNAILLTNAGNKPISGFYTLDGSRCTEFSEFAADAPIQAYKIDPAVLTGQQAPLPGGMEAISGYTIPIPAGPAYTTLQSQIRKRFPSTLQDYRRCPILLRAAIVTTCPKNPTFPNVLRSYVDPISSHTRCDAAQAVTVHIRGEQIYQINGQAPMETFDTVKGLSQRSISTEAILTQKNGGQCPVGSHINGPVCVYN